MKIYRRIIAFFTLFALTLTLSTVTANPLTLYAAGSLKAALSDVAASCEKTYGTEVTIKFGQRYGANAWSIIPM